MKKNKLGFTLIELLVVIMILGVLATLISGSFFTSLKKGRDARRKADLEQIQRALEMYYEDRRIYPSIIYVAGGELSEDGKIYMKKVPLDPLGSTYGYEPAVDGTYYKLYACLENDQQILPYLSTPASFSCTKQCFKPDKTKTTEGCVWGIASTNVTP